MVEERWGSLGELAVSVASRSAAPSRAHLTAIHNRKKGPVEEKQTVTDAKSERAYEKVIRFFSTHSPVSCAAQLCESV